MAERAVESVSTFLDLEVGKRLVGCSIRATDPVKLYMLVGAGLRGCALVSVGRWWRWC